jgi:hypothetical protein
MIHHKEHPNRNEPLVGNELLCTMNYYGRINVLP